MGSDWGDAAQRMLANVLHRAGCPYRENLRSLDDCTCPHPTWEMYEKLMAKKPPKPPRVDDSDALLTVERAQAEVDAAIASVEKSLEPPFEYKAELPPEAFKGGVAAFNLPITVPEDCVVTARIVPVPDDFEARMKAYGELMATAPGPIPCPSDPEPELYRADVLTLIDALETTLKGRDLSLEDIRGLKKAVEKL